MSIGTKLKSLKFLRKVDVSKETQCSEWLEQNKERNSYDPAILRYPVTEVFACHNNGTTYSYVPVQTVAVIESLGVNPEASSTDVADALIEAVKGVALLAHRSGMREIWFMVSDELTQDGAKKLGFELVTDKAGIPVKVARMRLHND